MEFKSSVLGTGCEGFNSDTANKWLRSVATGTQQMRETGKCSLHHLAWATRVEIHVWPCGWRVHISSTHTSTPFSHRLLSHRAIGIRVIGSDLCMYLPLDETYIVTATIMTYYLKLTKICVLVCCAGGALQSCWTADGWKLYGWVQQLYVCIRPGKQALWDIA